MWNDYFDLIVNYIYSSKKIIAIEINQSKEIVKVNQGVKTLISEESTINKPLSRYFKIKENSIGQSSGSNLPEVELEYVFDKKLRLFFTGYFLKGPKNTLYIFENNANKETNIIEKIGEVNLELSNLARDIHKKNKALKSKNNIITSLMFQDPLTKLHNRRYLYEKFEKLSSMLRMNSIDNITMAIMDIDNFKTINDTYGHDIGDEVLVVFANLIKSISRENDLKVRFGGDEFILILVNGNLEITKKRMEQLKHEFENVKIKGVHRPLTTSIGIAEYKKYEDFQNLLIRADKLLYKAKELGRNTIVTESSEK